MPLERPFMLFSGSSNASFAEKVSDYLGVALGSVSFQKFPDGEQSLQILDSVRGQTVFVVQSIARDPSFYLMELLMMVDALRRASAHTVVVVAPYFGYARQDRKDKPRVPVTAKLVANLLEKAGVGRLLTMDLHAGQVQGFFDIPVDHLYAMPHLVKAIKSRGMARPVVVAPDLGAVKLGRELARRLDTDLAVVDKERLSAEEVTATAIIGKVSGRDVVLVDDMCSTAGTLAEAAWVCKEKGAGRVMAVATHGMLVGEALERIEKSPLEAVVVTDTLPGIPTHPKIEVISVADIFGEAIRCVIEDRSINRLFEAPLGGHKAVREMKIVT